MNLIRKVNRARTDGQLDDVALGSEHDNLVGQQFVLKFAKKAFIVNMLFPQLAQLVKDRKSF